MIYKEDVVAHFFYLSYCRLSGTGLPISYKALFLCLLGKEVWSSVTDDSCDSLFLKGIHFLFLSPFLFIYILLLINYKYYKGECLEIGGTIF